ncbi:IDEAL domain-containing protein [Vagococcus coleopterorum]|uniref:IDEAL domain-containing protein n=1 Tax=Vagococcus coleopterorum TaxID=2714946 RepID=A0A6G8ANR0_9ENTE|nr:YpiB family protein [Vagococcus coleopterorum]QIL46609.1 IDEAL domain-containing protein [Vagococcus coleopterorum]
MVKTNEKVAFLDWVITHSIFTRREAYWLLTYLKDHPTILENVKFVEKADKTPRGMTIIQSSQPDNCFSLVLNKKTITDHEKIFHEIRLNWKETLYVEVIFDKSWENDLYLSVLEDNPFDAWNKQLSQQLEQLIETSVKEITDFANEKQLLEQIDRALDAGDQKTFRALTQQLQKQKIKEKSQIDDNQ